MDCGYAISRSPASTYPYVIITDKDGLPLAVSCNQESWETMEVGAYFCGEKIKSY